jgi:BlaI family transcriptional regulator, penicillinase repressor
MIFMSVRPTPLPTEAELEILSSLWAHGPSTVREVADRLTKSRSVVYTTVLKMLQVMHQKGLVTRDESQRNHVYAAVAPREGTEERLLGELARRAFGGSTTRLMMRALDRTRATEAERAQIRELLARLEDEDDAEAEP